MGNNRTAQLLAASFKGVSFNIRTEASDEAGRKIVLHRYVSSDEQFIEDQGQIPTQITLTIFVHGEDFIARAQSLEAVLNEVGPGLLTTPTFGTVEVFAGPYTKGAAQTNVGEITYTVPFFAGRPAAGPSQAMIGSEEVYQFGDEARGALETEFEEVYPEIDDSANALVAAGDLTTLTADIETTIKTILPTDSLRSVNNLVQSVALNASKLIRDPGELAKILFRGIPSAPGIWEAISLGLSEVEAIGRGIDQLTLLASALGGGLSLQISDINRSVAIDPESTEIPLWPETTAQRINRNDARLIIVNGLRVGALVSAYEVAAAKSYISDDEVTQTRNDIEDLYEALMLDETDDYDLIQSKPGVRNAVEDVRLAALEVIGQKEQEAFEIVEENIKAPTSAFALAYRLYAEDFTNGDELGARGAQLSELNAEVSSISLKGDIKIFQVTR